LSELCKRTMELSSKQNGTINDYKDMIHDVNSRYDKLMGLYESMQLKYLDIYYKDRAWEGR